MLQQLFKQSEAQAERNESLVRRLIERITVYDENMVVEFKSGMCIEVDG